MNAGARHFFLQSLHRTLSALGGRDVELDAVELEHAVHVSAGGCPVAYSYGAQRAIHLATAGRLQDLRRDGTRPYLRLLALPVRELFAALPCHDACARASSMRAGAEALLRDLGSPDLSHVPDAGIRCSKCGSSEISFEFLQTRSADEGTTVYCTCSGCSKRWKM
jgi:hypothetical protein